MNLINMISRNKFLKQLYPDGILSEVKLGQLCLDVGGRCSINIHTKKRPTIAVKKWGTWGKDYNTVVIKLLGSQTKDLFASDWSKISYSELIVSNESQMITLSQNGSDWRLNLAVSGLVFQSCDVHLDGEDDPPL
ncbi:hypothetical protein [Saccharospirillum alexandrii]|jgi:hypothetical protein|uniref:hypothetical protein n=1 Tax=Saccharospirillum alexandrii TaxID=2448477 RepID=UPI000FD7BA34|nr:hypothetical protein [Saccharospirillum alexandrii]